MMRWKRRARRAAKTLVAGALHYSGIQGLLSRASRIAVGGQRVLIISYHRVVENFAQEAQRSIPGLLVSKATFARHLEQITRAGYDLVSLGEALEVLAGRSPRPRDVAVITFDDGYRDVYEHAFPLLKQKGISATVYLASGYIGTGERLLHDRLYSLLRLSKDFLKTPHFEIKETNYRKDWPLEMTASALRTTLEVIRQGFDVSQHYPFRRFRNGGQNPGPAQDAARVDRLISTRTMGELKDLVTQAEAQLVGEHNVQSLSGELLSWPMVREMAASGICFGAHTVNHVVLTHESKTAIDWELSACKQAIESQIGMPVLDFAYPNGFYDRCVMACLLEQGYRSAVTTEDFFNQAGKDPLRLCRKTLWEDFSMGPLGYSSKLTACHLEGIFTLLALTRPIIGERTRNTEDPQFRTSTPA